MLFPNGQAKFRHDAFHDRRIDRPATLLGTVQIDQVRAIERQADVVEAQDRRPTPDEVSWVGLREATARSMQPLMIGAAVAGGTSLVAGVILLATRQPRKLSVRPFAGLREAGLVLQGRF